MKFIRTELVSDLLSKFRATFFGLLIADINIKFTLKPSEKINIFRVEKILILNHDGVHTKYLNIHLLK